MHKMKKPALFVEMSPEVIAVIVDIIACDRLYCQIPQRKGGI